MDGHLEEKDYHEAKIFINFRFIHLMIALIIFNQDNALTNNNCILYLFICESYIYSMYN